MKVGFHLGVNQQKTLTTFDGLEKCKMKYEHNGEAI